MDEPEQFPPAINETDIVIVDVETTGLSPNSGDRVCEVGVVRLRGGAILETFGTLINPCRPISPGASAVNGITLEMVADAPEFPAIADRFLGLTNEAVLGAYNTPFDLSFLNNELRLAGHPPLANPTIDVLAMARQLLPGLGKYSQESVARTVGIRSAGKHRALDDALVTAQLFVFFTSIMKAYRLTSVDDLRRKDITELLRAKRLEVIQEALNAQRRVWIKYLQTPEATIETTMVSPKEMMQSPGYRGDIFQLLGFCHTSNANKIFNVDKILDVRVG